MGQNYVDMLIFAQGGKSSWVTFMERKRLLGVTSEGVPDCQLKMFMDEKFLLFVALSGLLRVGAGEG